MNTEFKVVAAIFGVTVAITAPLPGHKHAKVAAYAAEAAGKQAQKISKKNCKTLDYAICSLTRSLVG